MDNPFSADNNNPFQTPYQQPADASAPAGIKPFTAVDLAPPAGQNGNRHSAPPAPGPVPIPNAFSGGDFNSAFMSREAPIKSAAPAAPSNAPAPKASPLAAPTPMPAVNTFASKPLAAPMPDFSPAPMPMHETARQSQILSMSDFNDSVNRVKPVFFVSTTQTVDGFQIQDYLGLLSVEVVIPKDVLFRNPAPYGELHRIKAAEDQLQKVKAKALEELGEKAKGMGADGVVGVSLQFSQFDAIVCLCSAVGTAVKLAG
jgi:uncharacterized protein YbjQ (UPF0145 family)